MKGEAIRGHLDLLLLALLAEEPLHGYALIERLRVRSGGEFDLPEGTVYPALHRLEHADLLTSEWDETSGRRRRSYRLTQRGREVLGEEQSHWRRFSSAVSATLGGVRPWPTTP